MGLFSTGSDDVIVACVREVIDQLNQVRMSAMKMVVSISIHMAKTTCCICNDFRVYCLISKVGGTRSLWS